MKRFIKILIVLIMLYICFNIVQPYNLNGFKLAHYYEGLTNVKRDRNEKYNSEWSYKIESTDYNDFMVYKTLDVKKNTSYKLSCMVKTKDVQAEYGSSSGFNICLREKLEKSESITGTNDWQELVFYFESKDKEKIDVAFRLGDNETNCKGTVWFSNIKLEIGRKKQEKDWNFAFFMINNTNLNVNGEKIKKQLSNVHKGSIKNAISGFKETMQNFTNNSITIDYDIIVVDKPLTQISYDPKTGYYISELDSYELINEYIYDKEVYDHIFIVANIGDDIGNKEIEWIGLGGMLYNNIGYSNIRVSDKTLSVYTNSASNYFSEEVIVHEFLHTFERNSIELGFETVALHDYSKYGYENESKNGLYKWYRDYVQDNIGNNNQAIKKEVYYTQPISESNFRKREEVTQLIYNERNIVHKLLECISKII